MEVKGRSIINGLPQTITITSEEIDHTLNDSVNKIIKTIKQVLENTPPELSADIINNGIYIEEFLRSDIQRNLLFTGITRFKDRITYVKERRKYF